MLIDWFTVVAQVINFLILVFLLKRFLYKPIIDAIDKRKKFIADQLKEATNLKMDAEDKISTYDGKQKDWEKTKERILKGAQDEANERKEQLLEEARSEYADLRRKLKDSLEKDKILFGSKLKAKAKEQVVEIARKVMRDLGDANLEDQVLRLFMDKINNLSDLEVKKFASKMAVDEKIVVTTEFSLNHEQQNSISASINRVFNKNMPLEFTVGRSDALIGIELAVKGYKVSWAVGNYLDKLEKETLAVANEFDTNQS